MAVVAAISGNEGLQYNGRVTWLVVLCCVMAATGGLLWGYDSGVTGGVTSMEPFLKKFFPGVYEKMKEDTEETSNYCKFDNQLLTLFTSSIYLSGLVASFFASPVTRDYGRRRSMIIGAVAFFTGAAIGGAAGNIYVLLLGRLLLGVGIGFTNQSVPLYLSEMAPPKNRGSFNVGFQFCVGFGNTIAFFINYCTQKIAGDWGWRLSLALAVLPASILIVGAIFLPETPNSLLHRGHDPEKAKKLLQRIRGTDDVDGELDHLITATHNAAAIKHPFKKILQRKYRPCLVMAIAIPFFQQMNGITVIASYSPILFLTVGFGESASLLSAFFLGVIGLCTVIVSSLIVDKLGRRIIFQVGGIAMFVTQMVVGAIMAAELGDYGALSKGYSILVIIFICIYTAAYALSWGPLGWLVTSEIFPLEIRSAAQSMTVAVSFFFSFLLGQIFLALLCRLKSATFYFFGGWVALMTVFVYFLLPETKNKPIEKMDVIWREHSFWRRFVIDDYNGNECKESSSTDEPLLHSCD